MIVESLKVKAYLDELSNSADVIYSTEYGNFSEGELAALLKHDLGLIEFLPTELITPGLTDFVVCEMEGFGWIAHCAPHRLTSRHLDACIASNGPDGLTAFRPYVFTPDVVLDLVTKVPGAYLRIPDSAKTPELSAQLCSRDHTIFNQIPVQHHTPELFLSAIIGENLGGTDSRENLYAATEGCWNETVANAVFDQYTASASENGRTEAFYQMPARYRTAEMYATLGIEPQTSSSALDAGLAIEIPDDIDDLYVAGNCMYLAAALNRLIGWPICVALDSDSPEAFIDHTWVANPAIAMMFDINGCYPESRNSFIFPDTVLVTDLDEAGLLDLTRKTSGHAIPQEEWDARVAEALVVVDEHFASQVVFAKSLGPVAKVVPPTKSRHDSHEMGM